MFFHLTLTKTCLRKSPGKLEDIKYFFCLLVLFILSVTIWYFLVALRCIERNIQILRFIWSCVHYFVFLRKLGIELAACSVGKFQNQGDWHPYYLRYWSLLENNLTTKFCWSHFYQHFPIEPLFKVKYLPIVGKCLFPHKLTSWYCSLVDAVGTAEFGDILPRLDRLGYRYKSTYSDQINSLQRNF